MPPIYPIDPLGSGLYVLQGRRMWRGMSYRCDIWGVPTDSSSDAGLIPWDGNQGSAEGNEIRLYTNVPVSKQATKEFDQQNMVGRGELTNLETLDTLVFHASQPLMDGQFVQITLTPDGSGASTGLWWTILGNAQAYDWRANTARVIAKRVLDPPSGWAAANQAPAIPQTQ